MKTDQQTFQVTQQVAQDEATETGLISGMGQYYSDSGERKSWYYDGSSFSKLSIDIYSIWDEYRGEGIKIGVVDTQINYNHVELNRAYDTSLDYNFVLGTNDPQIDPDNLPDGHGTQVAGVISAEGGNGVGTAGVAQDATLVGFGIDYSAETAVEDILAALDAAVTMDVVNNSWSFNGAFVDNFASNPDYEAPLVKLVTQGRDGLGTNIVFAAGNDKDYVSSNYHNFQNSPYTIAVGAVESNGDAAEFSSRGSNVLLSAAGVEVFTTTVGGGLSTTKGTSFSAPAVSGAIALMLEANSDLGYRDVQEILAYSSTRYKLADDTGFGEGWMYTGVDNHNGGGLHYNDAFGFGLLNVHNAVRLAETWQTQHTISNRETVSQTVTSDIKMKPGVNDHISLDIDVTDDLSLEHVQLSIKFDYRWVADLDVYLTSPDGTQVRLVYDVEVADKSMSKLAGNFNFTSVASMGENAQGTWTIDIINRRAPDEFGNKGAPTGTLTGATLSLHGSPAVLEDDTYIYTNEYGQLYGDDDQASRSVLNDTDGGVDTINASPIKGAVIIDLSGATASSLSGNVLSITANTIENVFSGDGDDVIRGSNSGNVISTGRGNDKVHFSLGQDTIDGGAGSDTLFAGSALAAFTVEVYADGKVGLSKDGAYTLADNFETFVFNGSNYSVGQLGNIFGITGGEAVDPVPEIPATEPPVTEDPVTEDPVTEDPIAEDPIVENPVTDDPATNDGENYKGTKGNDQKTGNNGADLFLGKDGHDTLSGGGGNDDLNGNRGNDTLVGGAGDDLLRGGQGDDWLWGGEGSDTLYGDDGADTFVFDISDIGQIDRVMDFNAAEGDQIVITGLSPASAQEYAFVEQNGNVFLQVAINNVTYNLAQLNGVVVEDPVIEEPVAEDPVTEDPVAEDPATDITQVYQGTSGNDERTGGNGADLLQGMSGDDRLFGGDGDDELHGNKGNDALTGGAGEDLLRGGKDDDWLWGGEGADVLYGDLGADTFVFDVSDIGNVDQIMDFNAAEGDRIEITGLSQASTQSYHFVEEEGSVFLQLVIDDVGYNMAKLNGLDLDSSALGGDSLVDMLYA